MNTETIQLTNSQIAHVFAMYYGCDFWKATPARPSGNNSKMDSFWLYDIFEDNRYSNDFELCKLLLTPLSAITDEDAIEVAKMIHPTIDADDLGYFIAQLKIRPDEFIYALCNPSHEIDTDHSPFGYFSAYQYLIQKSYAVPLFIEPNHPANGKTAIELGLALDKTQIK
jgi:hypothetical protein